VPKVHQAKKTLRRRFISLPAEGREGIEIAQACTFFALGEEDKERSKLIRILLSLLLFTYGEERSGATAAGLAEFPPPLRGGGKKAFVSGKG
jgi:hypothetical protein